MAILTLHAPALRCPCVPGGLCGNDEPAAHLAAAQLRVERSLFPRLTRATAWRARLAGARIARARAVGRSASRPQRTVAAQRAARGLDPTAHRDRAEGCCGAPASRWDGSVPSQSRAVRTGSRAAGAAVDRRREARVDRAPTPSSRRGTWHVPAHSSPLTLTRAPRARSGDRGGCSTQSAPLCLRVRFHGSAGRSNTVCDAYASVSECVLSLYVIAV